MNAHNTHSMYSMLPFVWERKWWDYLYSLCLQKEMLGGYMNFRSGFLKIVKSNGVQRKKEWNAFLHTLYCFEFEMMWMNLEH